VEVVCWIFCPLASADLRRSLAPRARKQRQTAHLLTDSTRAQDDDTLQDECGKNWAGTNKQTRKVAVEAICPLMPLPDVLVEYADPRRQRLLAH